jgi:glutamate-1-semialdehyde 2,1-aminomutase
VSRAKGSRIWDADGREYLDYTMGWGSTILGHADDRVQAAIRDVLDTGPTTPFPHPLEMEVSRLLVEDFAPAEMVVFGKNGSDVCTVAARMARVTTGKRVILSCGFHGWQDFAIEHFGRRQRRFGSWRRDVSQIPLQRRARFLRLYERYRHDLAAVMIDPAGPWQDDGPAPDADAIFLQTIADAARRAGSAHLRRDHHGLSLSWRQRPEATASRRT